MSARLYCLLPTAYRLTRSHDCRSPTELWSVFDARRVKAPELKGLDAIGQRRWSAWFKNRRPVLPRLKAQAARDRAARAGDPEPRRRPGSRKKSPTAATSPGSEPARTAPAARPRHGASSARAPAAPSGMRPYPVQLMGALAMCEGAIAEMATGEGKTLTAVARGHASGAGAGGRSTSSPSTTTSSAATPRRWARSTSMLGPARRARRRTRPARRSGSTTTAATSSTSPARNSSPTSCATRSCSATSARSTQTPVGMLMSGSAAQPAAWCRGCSA